VVRLGLLVNVAVKEDVLRDIDVCQMAVAMILPVEVLFQLIPPNHQLQLRVQVDVIQFMKLENVLMRQNILVLIISG